MALEGRFTARVAMTIIVVEIVVILALILVNAVFAMSEMAVVSSRRARLERLAASGSGRARAALDLVDSPERFLSTVQIGITLVGILAGAVGGATIAEQLGEAMADVPVVGPYAESFALLAVVSVVTYLSLVIGELAPKRLALGAPERIASTIAGPMRVLSRVATPAVWLLSASTDAVLRVLGARPSAGPPVTEEEIKILIEQGTSAGVFEVAEQEMIERVLRLGDLTVAAIMTPRREVRWIDAVATSDRIRRTIVETPHARYPVCRGAEDNVVGVVDAKDVLARWLRTGALDLAASIRRPAVLPETLSALAALDHIKRSDSQLALVVNEFGGVEGIVTLAGILGAVVDGVPGQRLRMADVAVRRDDDSWLLDGRMAIVTVADLLGISAAPRDRSSYHTLAGFVLDRIGRIPSPADHFDWEGWRFEVVDMDGRRIDKLLVARAPACVESSKEDLVSRDGAR